MRRWIEGAVSLAALVGALAVGPFGAAAAPPYVYGCTPAGYFSDQAPAYVVELAIYNGSASTANLTHKVLAGNGTILNSAYSIPLTSILPPTHTSGIVEYAVHGTVKPTEPNGTLPYSVRIVSDVPISATLTHRFDLENRVAVTCTPQ